MSSKTFTPFNEFYNPKKEEEKDSRTAEEILTEVKEILEMGRGAP